MGFKKKHYRQQVDMRDCGVAALAMVFGYYGSYYSLASLREKAKTTADGTTALGLVKVAEELGFETRAFRADRTLFDLEGVTYPLIVHVIKDGRLPHYYVVYKKDKKHLYIADPDPKVKMAKLTIEEFEKEWTGIVIALAPTPAYQPSKEKKNGLLDFVPLLFNQRQLVLHIVLATLLVTLINIVGSYYLQSIIDTYVPDQMKQTLSVISLGLIVVYILQQVLTYAQDYLLLVLGQRLSIDVILSYIKHVFQLPMSFFATRRTGEVVSRFTDANRIIDALASTLLSIFLDLSIVLILSVVLFSQNAQLFFLTILLLPIYAVIIFAFMKPFERLNNETMEANSVLSSSIIEDINGIETIKSLTSERSRYQKIDSEFVDYLKKSFAMSKAESLQKGLKHLAQLILNVLVLWMGAHLVMKQELSLGQLITYNTLLVYFTGPLENLINLQTKLQAARVANTRLNEVYLIDSEFAEKKPLQEREALDGDLVFEGVDYKYGFGANVLTDINLRIKKGSKVSFVGISGSGKTTLSKIFDDEHTLISYTTRPPRPGEVDGVDYYFLSEAQATELSESNSVFEETKFQENLYGVTKDEVVSKTDNFTNHAVLVADTNFYSHVFQDQGDLYYEYGDLRVKVYPVILNLPIDVAIERIKERGGDEEQINGRIERVQLEQERVSTIQDLFCLPVFNVLPDVSLEGNVERFVEFLDETYNI